MCAGGVGIAVTGGVLLQATRQSCFAQGKGVLSMDMLEIIVFAILLFVVQIVFLIAVIRTTCHEIGRHLARRYLERDRVE